MLLKKKVKQKEKKKRKEQEEFSRPSQQEVDDILSMNIPTLREQAARIHGALKRWTTYSADCKRNYKIQKLARDTRFYEACREVRLHLLASGEPRASQTLVDSLARRDEAYTALARDTIDAEREFDIAQGVISALVTKRDMARSLLYAVGVEYGVANRTPEIEDRDVNDLAEEDYSIDD